MGHAQMLYPDEQIRDSSVCAVLRWLLQVLKTNEPSDTISTGLREH